MCNFDVPIFTYYTHIPLFIISALIGIYILAQNHKSQINSNLFIFSLLFCFWVINDLLQWIAQDEKLNLIFTRISVIETFCMLFFIYFVFAFLEIRMSKLKKFLLALPFFPVLLFMFSNYNVSSFIDCTPEFGALYIYIYLIAIIYMSWSVVLLVRGYRSQKADSIERKQIKIIIWAIIFFVAWFLFFLGISMLINSLYSDDTISQVTPYGILIFIFLIVYAITKYGLFDIKLLATQALVAALVIGIGSQFFFIQNQTNMILNGITLVLALGFGYMLVRSVKLEVQRKEELQKISDLLSTANDKLHQLDKAKSEFISIASHQLRTPLTSIKGFGSLLLEGTYGQLPETQRNPLEKIYIANERLIQLVEDLLNISRIEAGRMEFDFQEAQIEDLVQEAVTTLELSAKAKNLYLHWQKPAQLLPKIKIDITKIKEVISNMVDNAIKYTLRGGVTVKAERGSFFDHVARVQKNVVRVVVSDTGIGMEKDELESIFNKFERGKDVSHYHTDGTGLGMYVGKKIVAEHKGQIWAESEGRGKGSRFILELPVNML
ncbi:MAG: hypothetical protein A3J76_00240 [Candidatus Moranbacteria bacterium RBG_13_45_13]|nr:MAG: hypothetical protein A3J76_00240 [Candidatus Moranbacteria bacterium RBG_13_45_13]